MVAGLKITREEADALLARDLGKYEAAVEKAVKVSLTQNQFDALVSWTYNLGPGNLGASQMLKLLNKGDYGAVPAQMILWTRAGGKVLPGLVKRRHAEAALWSGVPAATTLVQAQPVFVAGDSIAEGLRAVGGYDGVTQVGANPTHVLELLSTVAPERIAGKKIVLSTGASNDFSPGQLGHIHEQISTLVAKGADKADIHVAGVGDRKDYAANGLNSRLAVICGTEDVTFIGPLDPAGLSIDRVHPRSPAEYRKLLAEAVPKTVDAPAKPISHTTTATVASTMTGTATIAASTSIPWAKVMPFLEMAGAALFGALVGGICIAAYLHFKDKDIK